MTTTATGAPKRAPKPSTTGARFTVEVGVQVDGEEEVSSRSQQADGPTPVILPASMWSCWTRPTQVASRAIAGASLEFFSKELVCAVENTETNATLAQVGTAVVCVRGIEDNRRSYFYLRERDRLLRLTLRCAFED
jgi:hypothetical protein